MMAYKEPLKAHCKTRDLERAVAYCFADILVNILIKKSYEIYLNEFFFFLSIHKFTDILEVKLFK